jgi:transposase
VNALELFREVKAQSFLGGATAVHDFVRPFRDPNMPPAVLQERRAIPSPRSLAWLLVSQGKFSPKKQDVVDELCAAVPALTQSRDLVVTFKDMMPRTASLSLRRRAAEELEDWLESAKGSRLVGFSSFVRGIRSDYATVQAAFSLE